MGDNIMNKRVIALSLAALTILLLMSQTSVQGALIAPNMNVGSQALNNSKTVEFLTVVAGIGTSALVQIATFGDLVEADYPITYSAALQQASSWTFYVVDQANYASYLVRPPLPAPDGAVLALTYPSTLPTAETLAQQAAALFETEYSIQLFLVGTYISHNEKVFMFTGGDKNTVLSPVLDDVTGFSSDGFNGLIDKAVVNNAPVKAVGYGAMKMGHIKVSYYGVIYVEPNAISGVGSMADPYVMSTQNIFNQVITPRSDAFVSRVRFNFPYVINVLPNGITPAQTSNPVPQLTGTFIWDLKHPDPAYSLGQQSDLSVKFTIPSNGISEFPMVSGRLYVDNSLLNQGTLNVTVSLENKGDATAYHVKMGYPLGAALSKLINQNITAWVLKDDVTYDPNAVSANYSLKVETNGLSSLGQTDQLLIDQMFMQLNGWFMNQTSNTLMDWDASTNDALLLSLPIEGTSGAATIDFHLVSNNGMPTFLVNVIAGVLNNVFSGVQVNLLNLASLFGEGRGRSMFLQSINATYWSIMAHYYQEKPYFILNGGDFNVEQVTVAAGTPYEHTEYVLSVDVAQIAPHSTVNVSWALENVPAENDNFVLPQLGINQYLDTQGKPHNYAIISGNTFSVADVFRYIFDMIGFDGRFATLPFVPSDMQLWLPGTATDKLAIGAIFSYEDTNGYGYFGITNGINFQYGDDEAVLVTDLSANGTVFHPGEGIKFTATIENIGDADASDVTVYFYHARLDRGWRLRRIQLMAAVPAPDIAAGNSVTVDYETIANSYLGYHPVFAVVEFTTEKGQAGRQIVNFANLSDPINWVAGGETKILTFSNLFGGLLLGSPNMKPSFPQPVINQQTSVSDVDNNNQFTYTVTVSNDGNAPTNVTLVQYYNSTELQFVSATISKGTGSQVATTPLASYQSDSILLNPGESVTLTITFKLLVNHQVIIPPAVVVYTSLFESELGDHPVLGLPGFRAGGSTSVPALLGLNAEAQATGSAEEQATGQKDYTSYSSSTAVGANIASNSGTVTGRQLFAGSNEFLAVATLAVSAFAVLKRKKQH